MTLRDSYRIVSTLGKFSISLPVGFSAYVGYVVASKQFDGKGILVLIGIFLLSAAASLFNQIQEQHSDALMDRTKLRPLPKAVITNAFASLIGLAMLFFGAVLLYLVNIPALIGGLVGLIWYNLIYTPLKRVTAFSVFPGAIVGAVPPIAGWLGGGGELFSFPLLLLGFFFFIGQMPHFWLLVIKYGQQYSSAGFPTLTNIFSVGQIMRINMVWFWASFVTALFLPFTKLILHQFNIVILVITTLIMMGWSLKMTLFDKRANELKVRPLFVYFNSYYLLVMVLLLLDVLLS